MVQRDHPDCIVIALDPVNFEQPVAEKLEHLSEVWKSTPPGSLLKRRVRITRGYLALLAQTVNLTQPALLYARWFSHISPDFVSENLEIQLRCGRSGPCSRGKLFA